MLEEHEESLPGFEKLKLETLVVSHKTIEGIIQSFRTIGRVCGKGPEGRRMAYQYENRLRQIQEKTRRLPRPRVLLALDRTLGRGHLADVYVVGSDDYFDRIIELAGGQNVYQQRGVRYPVVSTEGILWLNPDVIVDLVPKSVLRADRSEDAGGRLERVGGGGGRQEPSGPGLRSGLRFCAGSAVHPPGGRPGPGVAPGGQVGRRN